MLRTTWSISSFFVLAIAAVNCGGTSGTGGPGATAGRGGPGGPGSGGMVGPAGSAGSTGNNGATGGTGAIVGGSDGVFTCTPGVQQLVITDCGYPYVSSNPLTSTVFNESEVLRAIQPSGTWPNGVVSMFYNDEHALTLGVRNVAVKTAGGTTSTDYPVSPLAASPSSVTNPQTGTNDPDWRSERPRRLVAADVAVTVRHRHHQRSQQPSRRLAARRPADLAERRLRFVEVRGAHRRHDQVTPPTVTITPDADPAKNNWSIAGGNTPPTGLKNEGFGAEARWNVALVPGHSYRLQVIVHDGDQNKVGGDSGEACVLFCAGGSCPTEGCDTHTTGTGGNCGSSDGCPDGGGTPKCPEGTLICGAGGVDPSQCPAETVCANGCCIPHVS